MLVTLETSQGGAGRKAAGRQGDKQAGKQVGRGRLNRQGKLRGDQTSK